MKRIPVSCSILTPRLRPGWRRPAWLALAIVVSAGAVGALAERLPYFTGPLIACAVGFVAWLAAQLSADRPRAAANDNGAVPLPYTLRPVLNPVPAGIERRRPGPRAGDAA